MPGGLPVQSRPQPMPQLQAKNTLSAEPGALRIRREQGHQAPGGAVAQSCLPAAGQENLKEGFWGPRHPA